MLQGGGRTLEDLRELKNEEGLRKLVGHKEIPEADTVGGLVKEDGDPRADRKG